MLASDFCYLTLWCYTQMLQSCCFPYTEPVQEKQSLSSLSPRRVARVCFSSLFFVSVKDEVIHMSLVAHVSVLQALLFPQMFK